MPDQPSSMTSVTYSGGRTAVATMAASSAVGDSSRNQKKEWP